MPNELLPTNIQFGTVVGRFGSAPLIAGDADGFPDFSPAAGLTVTFTPSTAAVIDATASPAPVTIEMVPIVCGLDTQGYLVGGDGQRGVKLIATNDTDINPSGWTYSVTFLRGGAKVAAFRDFSMSLPAGVTKDIALTIPVPSSEGVSLSQAQAAEAAAVSAASQANAAAAAAAASAATFVPATVDTLGQATTVGKAIAKATDASAARVAIAAASLPSNTKHALTGWYHADGFGFLPANTAAQNDTAITAALAAMPRTGATLYIPEGMYRFTSFGVPTGRSVNIRGAGANVNTHAKFGDAVWPVQTSTLGGTVLISEKSTDGGAITVPPNSNCDNSTISDLSIIGPGTGTSTGLVLGGSGGGYPVRVRLRNVTIGNFSTGFLGSNENGQIDSMFIIGCDSGFTTMYPFNGNVINALNVEYSTTVAVRLVDSASNVFTGGVLQANYGDKTISIETSTADSTHNVFNGMYFENFGSTTTPVVPYEEISVGVVGTRSCTANEFISPQFSSAVRVISGANTSPILRFGTNAKQTTLRAYEACPRVNIEGNASHNLFHGLFNQLGLYDTSTQQITNRVDDTGSRTYKLAAYAQFPAVATTDLPTPGGLVGAGATLYNSTTKSLIVTDGTSWRTASGQLITAAATNIQPRSAQTLAANGAVTIDANSGDAVITLQANATSSTITNPAADQILRITWIQDATGGRTYAWPTNCKFAGGSAPADTTASRQTTVTIRYTPTTGAWHELSRAVAV